MRFLAVEYLSYCLTIVGSESSNDLTFSLLRLRSRRQRKRAVGVPSKQNWAVGSLEKSG